MATEGCPDDEALARVAAGDAADVERDDVLAHVDRCSACRHALALLAALPPTPAESFVGGDHLSTFREEPSEIATHRVQRRPRPAGVTPALPALGDRIGRYVALRILGRGGMGIVIGAHDPELDRQVAIKLVHPKVWRAATDGTRDLLRLEARAMARLVHPNVVAVHDLGTVGDQLFVAMELVAGSSLDHWLSAKPRPWRDVLAMCCEAGKGVAAAHRAGLVHRDIKPHNVLVDETERPRIADFGLAVLGHSDPSDQAGTPAYMSPEQHRGTAVTAASDQFSFCVMVYEALYGERPFAGETVVAIAAEIERGTVRAAPEKSSVPSRVRRVLLRGLATEADARFPSMDALLEALVPAPRVRWKLSVAAIALAAVAGAGVMTLTRTKESPLTVARKSAEGRAADVWSPTARAAVDTTLAAGSPAHGDSTRSLVHGALDAYVARWIDAQVEVTRAARDGEQVPAAAERRLACLDRRLGELRALVGALAAGGQGVATNAIDGVLALTPAQVCLDRDVMAVRPPPEEPRRRARYDELSRKLDEVVALDRLGRQKDAIAAAAAVVGDVRALDHAPLTAEALALEARLLATVGESDRAIATYREMLPIAATAGDAQLEARGWIELVVVTINAGHGRPPEDMMVAVGSAVARAGDVPEIRRKHQMALAAVAISDGRYAEAEAIRRRVLGELTGDTREHADVLLGVGAALGEHGKFEEALPLFEEARAVAERVYGPAHPEMAIFWMNIEVSLHTLARYEEALAAAHQIAALAEPGTLNAGIGMMYEGGDMLAMGRDDEALERLGAAVTIFRDSGNRRQQFEALMNMGATYYNLDELDQARAAVIEALDIGNVMFAGEPAQLVFANTMLGMIELDRGELDRSRALCEEAVASATDFAGEHPDLPQALLCVAMAARQQHRAIDALATAERALRVADQRGVPEYRHEVRIELVRTLRELGRDRARRRTLLREAIALDEIPERRAAIEKEFRDDLR
jgi:tetratricopeptide (TPR) repeat protein/tRNA A-37 threonylcarbamoyl transferase component Bud32